MLATTLVLFLYYVLQPRSNGWAPSINDISMPAGPFKQNNPVSLDSKLVMGKPISSKMTNETIRAELGRSSWKLFHTILAQYPEEPTTDEREALSSYIHLFSRVYPCRECAEHFQLLLKEFPPQTATREIASQWGCHVHNQVNKRLKKPIFDCNDISSKYMCGCAEDEKENDTNIEKPTEHDKQPELQHGG